VCVCVCERETDRKREQQEHRETKKMLNSTLVSLIREKRKEHKGRRQKKD